MGGAKQARTLISQKEALWVATEGMTFVVYFSLTVRW